jgi:hypothetical protein
MKEQWQVNSGLFSDRCTERAQQHHGLAFHEAFAPVVIVAVSGSG